MDLTIGNIIVGGFISLIGMALILYGRKELRVPHGRGATAEPHVSGGLGC